MWNQLLPVGKTTILRPGDIRCTVEACLGSGGQGEVYRVWMEGEEKAVVWYFEESGTPQQAKLLRRLVDMGPPTSSGEFLWPERVVTCPTVKSFGYVMPIRSPRFKSIVDLMRGEVHPSFRILCTVARKLAHSYWSLHHKGFCYRDINFNNVFFDPATGDILICDNDNVSIAGERVSGVIGTQRFMAPEIVRGEAEPSAETDKYSLAVLLFYLLFVHHPLEGKRESDIHCLDKAAMDRLYGYQPIFIYDPNDESNRPVPGYHDNAIKYWNVYPTFIKRLFVRAFTDGLKPNGRVGETEWRRAFAHLADCIVYCQKCGRENFYDDEVHCYAGASLVCWKCQARVTIPFILRIANNAIVLRHDTKLYPYHMMPLFYQNHDEPVAQVSQHPQDPSRWGLTNQSNQQWVAQTAEGSVVVVPQGKTIRLHKGLRIDFGSTSGIIE